MLDQTIHEIFSSTTLYKKLPNKAVIRCKECGTPLKTYYAEGRLYLVKCGFLQYGDNAEGKRSDNRCGNGRRGGP